MGRSNRRAQRRAPRASGGNGRKRPQPRQPRRRGLLRHLVVWSLVAAIWLSIAAAGAAAYYAYDLPDLDKAMAQTREPSVMLLARDGSILGSYGELYGSAVTLSELPPALPKAVMAVEDRRFYSHFGLDPIGLMRAIVANIRAGSIVQGGSTITQQLAKNLFLTPERTFRRKVQELLLAFWLERRFSKDQILSLYLNRAYLGAGTFGVDAAARRFFGKPASEVNLYEAAMLAGLLKAPSRYNPASDHESAHRRTLVVLRNMVAAGYITEAEAAEAARERGHGRAIAAWRGRYFTDWVLSRVQDFVDYHPRDLVVETTLDPRLQRLAEEQVAAVLVRRGEETQARQAALVTLTPEGAVRAMVGGRNYQLSQFNRAVQARRQPGSAFKPFVYLAGMEAGLTPDRPFVDEPIRVGDWAPDNFGGRYYGEVTLREAFARSLNSVAVQVLQRTGPQEVAAVARRVGIASPLTAQPSLALGTSEVTLLELTGAYATFANQGRGVLPYGITEIRDRSGQVLYRRAGNGPGQVVEPLHVQQMTDILRANIVWGTGRGADPGRPAAGKTGTSQDFRDAWFIGFTAELVTGVWTGNDDEAPMRGVTGGTLPAEIWREVMTQALEGEPERTLPGMEIRVAERESAGAGTADTEGGNLIERIIRSLSSERGGDSARRQRPPPGVGRESVPLGGR